jgi:hypothetical protein
MSFSAQWLRLREPVDHRSRDQKLLAEAAAYLAAKTEPVIYDLGAGAGSNLRGSAPAFNQRQRWVLVDYDAALLGAALDYIGAWGEKSRPTAAGLEIERGGKFIRIEVKRADLAANPAPWSEQKPDLVASAALFDLVSKPWIARFCTVLAKDALPLYTTLVHTADVRWSPAHEADAQMIDAFERHFGTDKGFGPSAGGEAITFIAETLKGAGYRVDLADSPWRLDDNDHALISELALGWANAVRETGVVPDATIDAWLAARQSRGTSCVVGHKDLLALPAK